MKTQKIYYMRLKATVIKYGTDACNDAILKNINFNENGHGVFDLEFKGENLGTFELSVPGLHNIYNAAAAILTAYVSSIDLETYKS